jgi:hypothetical protein
MNSKLMSLFLLLGLVSLPLQAMNEASQWSSDFSTAFSEGRASAIEGHEPSQMAVNIAMRVGEAEFRALSPETAAGFALKLTLSADADIRKGLSFQEANARTRQQARLLVKDAASGGEANAQAMRKVRSRLASETGRSQSGGLVDPLGKGPASEDRGRTQQRNK